MNEHLGLRFSGSSSHRKHLGLRYSGSSSHRKHLGLRYSGSPSHRKHLGLRYSSSSPHRKHLGLRYSGSPSTGNISFLTFYSAPTYSARIFLKCLKWGANDAYRTCLVLTIQKDFL